MSSSTGASGWELVRVQTVYEIFKQFVAPPGFHLIKKGVLSKTISADITHLITLSAYKGGAYGFRWGVSLSYLPHCWETELRWHRTVKSVRLDLFEELSDLPDSLDLTKRPPNSSFPSALHGAKQFEQNLQVEWGDLRSTISGWLNRVQDVSGVLAMSSEQMRRNWRGPLHWPPPSLAHVFSLARAGRPQEAALELSEIINKEVSDPNGLLASALDKVSAG